MADDVRYVTNDQLGGTPTGRSSQAVRVGDMVYVSGQIGRDFKTGAIEPDIRGQTSLALENLDRVLNEAGATPDDVVKYTIYLVREEDIGYVLDVMGERLKSRTPPPATIVVVKALGIPGLLVEIEPIVVIGTSR